ncbi:MAG: threonine/serine dehydratase [Cohaesibacteraceae bacterium]
MITEPAKALPLSAIEAASERLAGQAVATPLVSNGELDRRTGGQVLLKCENLQRTGSFKFRGAYNTIASLSESERARGIVAVSSGNHAQGVAEAARMFGVPATICMPGDAPAVKTARVRRSGAQIVPYNRQKDDRNAMAEALALEKDAIFVRPYDDYRVMAGQGTAGLEAAKALQSLDLTPDIGLVCCGGGGLCAGVSTAWRAAFPAMAIYAVEPDGFDDTKRSLQAGQRLENETGKRSICDAILTERPGALTFPVNVANGVEGLTVSDDEVLAAMAFAFHELKMVLEPGGAVCLAALLTGRLDVTGKTVVAVLSGGNVDSSMMDRALASVA